MSLVLLQTNNCRFSSNRIAETFFLGGISSDRPYRTQYELALEFV